VRAVVLTAAAVLAVVVVVVTASSLVLVRRPLPDVSGDVELDGLRASVEVVRDDLGVPQVYAEDVGDLFRAQGYVQAQDRFFQMDFRRRAASGTLAELLGDDPDAIASDTAVRTLGFRRVAREEFAALSPQAQAVLEAYAEGVNDYLRAREASELAVEYSVLALTKDLPEIEPWTPVDSLVWLKALAWEMQRGDTDELERAAVYDVVDSVDRTEELFPPYPQELNPTILTAAAAAAGAPATRAVVAREGSASSPYLALGGGPGFRAITASARALATVATTLGQGEDVGSNSWVVSGELTASGRPLLAVDPHLLPTSPGPWYQLGLHCRTVSAQCPYDVSGIGFAGLPGVFQGHTGDVGFSLTALPADTTDYFVERVLDDGTYVRDGARVRVEQRVETIAVNGGDDVRVTVRSTVHGPIVSDALPRSAVAEDRPLPEGSPPPGLSGYSVAVGWTGLTPGRTFDGLLALNRAARPADVTAAAALLAAPALNVLWATADGDYGYQAAGRVPQRLVVLGAPVPSNGTWPRLGWDSAYDWQGTIGTEDLPAGTRPDKGYLIAANQAVLPAGVGPYLTSDWDAGFRAQRIQALLDQRADDGEPLGVADMAAVQADASNPYAAVLVPYLLRAGVTDPFVEEGVELLRSWDYSQTRDSAAAAYFASVWTNLLRLTFWDDVPEEFRPDGGSRWLEVVRSMLDDPQNPWWDDRSTLNVVETRDEVLIQAMTSARLQLTSSIGQDATRWQWSTLHKAAPRHPVFGDEAETTAVRDLFNPRAVSVDGGSSIVLATAWAAQDWDGDYPSFQVVSLPTARLVMDLGDPDASTWVTLTGTSGHPGSRHYTDQFGAWADGRTFPWPSTAEAVHAAERSTLRLNPPEG
jgi:penicillin amidase